MNNFFHWKDYAWWDKNEEEEDAEEIDVIYTDITADSKGIIWVTLGFAQSVAFKTRSAWAVRRVNTGRATVMALVCECDEESEDKCLRCLYHYKMLTKTGQ